MEPTASHCVTHWLLKLPAELRNRVYRLTFALLANDLRQRALTGHYSIEAGSTNSVVRRTLDALSGASGLARPTYVGPKKHAHSTTAGSTALTRHQSKYIVSQRRSVKPTPALDLAGEARSIWIAEYWPYVCRLRFRFVALPDYLTYHLPFVRTNTSLNTVTQIILEMPAGTVTRKRPFCRMLSPTKNPYVGGIRACAICELLDLVAFGCAVLEVDRHSGGFYSDYCQPEAHRQMWWRPESAWYWEILNEKGRMPKEQEFTIRGQKFKLDLMAWNNKGHTDR
ncbi:hypothetical protein LTR56_012279 [Elasticomyces elasticus]|nr:hypothetical protein LTR22_021044 [Elasticomyces elasticus]KAK3639702.1 hypothetical protein LTR56_012279 [Elasticomyces elasticus]KAK4922564.1 hypothetical protein LTR49_010091 [Elasticomyces elasticus]KAK5760737.1 hypothetical protein LTS12_009095 [Elasticomyces elasticus]